MNVDNGVNVPTAHRLKAALDALTEYTRPSSQLSTLIQELGDALTARIAAINSTNAAVVGRMENTLRDELVALRTKLLELDAVATKSHETHTLLFEKMHSVSNHIMAFESKLDELSQVLTMVIETATDHDNAES